MILLTRNGIKNQQSVSAEVFADHNKEKCSGVLKNVQNMLTSVVYNCKLNMVGSHKPTGRITL